MSGLSLGLPSIGRAGIENEPARRLRGAGEGWGSAGRDGQMLQRPSEASAVRRREYSAMSSANRTGLNGGGLRLDCWL